MTTKSKQEDDYRELLAMMTLAGLSVSAARIFGLPEGVYAEIIDKTSGDTGLPGGVGDFIALAETKDGPDYVAVIPKRVAVTAFKQMREARLNKFLDERLAGYRGAILMTGPAFGDKEILGALHQFLRTAEGEPRGYTSPSDVKKVLPPGVERLLDGEALAA